MTTHRRPTGHRTSRAWLVLRLCLSLVWLLAAEAHPAGSPSPGTAPVLSTGVLLVASPDLADPNFRHTVILICKHGPEGTVGLVLNRPTELLLAEALPSITSLQGTAHILFAGGPVQPEGILMLFRLVREPAQTRRVIEGVYLGGNLGDLERVLTQPAPRETFRAFAGYAGWGPGQLEWEMAQGSWVLAPSDAATLFEKNPADLWSDLIHAVPAPGTVQASPQPVYVSEAFVAARGLF